MCVQPKRQWWLPIVVVFRTHSVAITDPRRTTSYYSRTSEPHLRVSTQIRLIATGSGCRWHATKGRVRERVNRAYGRRSAINHHWWTSFVGDPSKERKTFMFELPSKFRSKNSPSRWYHVRFSSQVSAFTSDLLQPDIIYCNSKFSWIKILWSI